MSEEEMKALVEMNNMLKAKLEQQTKVYQQSLQEMQMEIDDLQRNCDVFNEQMNDAVERAMELQLKIKQTREMVTKIYAATDREAIKDACNIILTILNDKVVE